MANDKMSEKDLELENIIKEAVYKWAEGSDWESEKAIASDVMIWHNQEQVKLLERLMDNIKSDPLFEYNEEHRKSVRIINVIFQQEINRIKGE